MDKQEVLKKAQEKKPIVGEMEKTKIDKSNWIAVTVTGIIATIFMIVEGALGHYASIHAIGTICFYVGSNILLLSILHCKKKTFWHTFRRHFRKFSSDNNDCALRLA